ncbi:MAG: hypothetical protein ACREM1_02650 [Longimicrobiales bacterium]
MDDHSAYRGIPRWVKIFGIIAIVLVVLYIILHAIGIGGRHGPGRHSRSGDAGGQTAPASVIDDHGASRSLRAYMPSEVGHA